MKKLLVFLTICVAMCATSAVAAEFTMKLNHDMMVESPFHKSCVYMKDLIEKRSEGRMQVDIYPAMQLGNNREMIEGAQMGTIEAILVPTAKYGGFDQRLNLCDLPFLFPNEKVLWEMLEGEVGKKAKENLPNIGLYGVQYWAEGFKILTANKAMTSPADMKGLKIRTMEAPLIMSQFKAWGANPVPIDYAELYNSLQQKVVDGQENPMVSIHDMKFYEVQTHMVFMDHAYLSYLLTYSKAWFDKLPKDIQEIVWQAGLDTAQYHKSLMDETNARYLDDIKKAGGTEFIYLTEEQKAPWREAIQPLYKEYRDVIGGELIDLAVSESKRLSEAK
ncbi:TRAP transporter substrate-binding protein [Desulfovibrio sp. OttesenSCG-928-I05]|nr:TRAP transporter substrate-binding protein [Desulfovibrio sp. OttesenSCG-928-I05]